MNKFNNSYKDNPELIFIFLVVLFFFRFIVPLIRLYFNKRNFKKFMKLVDTLITGSSDSIINNSFTVCNFCGSNRFIKEIMIEVPHSSKYGFFFIKELGYIKLYKVRCGKCSSSLEYSIEKNEF